MTILTVYFSFVFLLIFGVKSVIIEQQSSLVALDMAREEELLILMMRLAESEDFVRLIRAKYFDYGPQVRKLCAQSNDMDFIERIVTKLAPEFPELAADCVAVASMKINFELANPLQSKYFMAADWTPEKYFEILKHSKEHKSIHAKFIQALKDSRLARRSTEYFNPDIWNQFELWTQITFLNIEKASKAIRNTVFEIVSAHFQLQNTKKRGELIARLLLIGFCYQRSVQGDANAIFTAAETSDDPLLQNLSKCMRFGGSIGPCDQYWLFEEVFDEIRIFTADFEPILNLVHFAAKWMRSDQDWTRVLGKVGKYYYGRGRWPSIAETCELLCSGGKLPQSAYILLYEFISQKPDYLQCVMQECGSCIPVALRSRILPLQNRAELFFKRSRQVNMGIGVFTMAVNEYSEDAILAFLQICNQFDCLLARLGKKLLNLRVRISKLDASGFLETDLIHNFPVLIRKFFELFLTQNEWFTSSPEEGGGIIPSLRLHPQFLFAFGFFLGAALVWNYPLPFKLSFDYFSLLDGPSLNVIKSFILEHMRETDEVLLLPGLDFTLRDVISAVLNERLEFGAADLDQQARALSFGLGRLRAGLEAACDISLFSLFELHSLLFNSSTQPIPIP